MIFVASVKCRKYDFSVLEYDFFEKNVVKMILVVVKWWYGEEWCGGKCVCKGCARQK